MSLINQMLQELDARRAEGTGSAEYGQQVRAVPERRRIHPAWWVAFALGIALLCVAGWLVLRPAPSAPSAPAATQAATQPLPLKLDTRLGTALPSTAADAAAPPAPSAPSAPSAPAPVTNVEAPSAAAGNDPALPTPAPRTPTPVSASAAPISPSPAEPEKAARRSPVPAAEEGAAREKAMPAPSARSRPAPPASPSSSAQPDTPPEAASSFASPKQSRELNSQQRAENEYRKALMAVEQGRIGEAINGLESALQSDARHAAARQSLIGLLLNAKRQDDAIAHARDGLALDEAQPALAMILARLQLEKGTPRTAADTLERTLPYARDRADYLAFLAAVLQRDERHKQAAEYYIQALQRSPQNGVWWMGLGISLQADQRLAEASEAFRRAKSTNALSPELTAFVNGRLSQLQR